MEQLKAVVARLASPASEQIEYLRSIGTYPNADELALEFEDVVVSPFSMRSRYVISPSEEAYRLIAALDDKLDGFSGADHADEWNASALASSSNWADVRNLAMRVLDALG